jgi:hypothetical protein
MENRIDIKLEDKITPRLLVIEAILLGYIETVLNDKQWEDFQQRKSKNLKRLISELVKDNPHLLEETPELKDILEDKK